MVHLEDAVTYASIRRGKSTARMEVVPCRWPGTRRCGRVHALKLMDWPSKCGPLSKPHYPYSIAVAWSDVSRAVDVLPQVSGIRFQFDASAEPGSRIVAGSVFVGDQQLVQDREYKVALKAYLHQGKDGFGCLKDAKVRWAGLTVGVPFILGAYCSASVQIVNDALQCLRVLAPMQRSRAGVLVAKCMGLL